MRSVRALTVIVLAISLAGCALRGKTQVARNTSPAPLPPPVAAPPPPPPEPLSIPQTNVHLPPEQPISEEALATTQPPDEPVLPPVVPRPPARQRPPVASVPKPETSPPAAVPQGPTPEPERQRIQEVLPASEQKRFQEEAEAYKREIRKYTDQAQAQPGSLNRRQQGLLDRVNSFVKQSNDAQARGDMRQAKELAGRALILARELQQ